MVGSERERIFRAACSARGLQVLAPGDDVALAFSNSPLSISDPANEVSWRPLVLTVSGGWAGAADCTGPHASGSEPIVNVQAVMRQAVDEFNASVSMDRLSEKDCIALATTSSKSLVVVLTPPTLPRNQQSPYSFALTCVVIHAKEPKSPAVVAVFASFAAKLIAAAREAMEKLLRTDFANLEKEEFAPPLWVLERLTGCDLSNFVVMSDTNIASTPLNRL